MSVVDLGTARTFLKITGTDDDAKLQVYIDGAEAAIAQRVGPLEATPVTDRIVPSGSALRLPTSPVISLTSVTPADGTALTLSDLYLDQDAGVVTYNNGIDFLARYYTVVYSAGRDTCPNDLKLAVLEQIRDNWTTAQRGGANRPAPAKSTEVSNTVAGANYELGYKVSQLIAPHIRPGFA